MACCRMPPARGELLFYESSLPNWQPADPTDFAGNHKRPQNRHGFQLVLKLFLFRHTGKCALKETVLFVQHRESHGLCFLKVTLGHGQGAGTPRQPPRRRKKAGYGMRGVWRHCTCLLPWAFWNHFWNWSGAIRFLILSAWPKCQNALQYTLFMPKHNWTQSRM